MINVHRGSLNLIVVFSMIVLPAISAQAQLFQTKQFAVNVISDHQYGVGTININTTPVPFVLTLDIYRPTGPGVPALSPGIVFAHGGAWIAGSKDDVSRTDFDAVPGSDTFDNPNNPGTGDTNTPTKDYARAFAERGYVAVSIDYRMVLDFPSGTGYVAANGINIGIIVSLLQSLVPSLTVTDITNAFEAGIADTVTAVQWMKTNAAALGIDPNSIALAGYSAGAINALHAAYIVGEDVNGLVINSGNIGNSNLPGFVPATAAPAIFFQGDNDDLVDFTATRGLVTALEGQGITVDYFEMLGEDHYYKIDRQITELVQKGAAPTLEELAAAFLFTELDLTTLGAVPSPAATLWGLVLTVAALALAMASLLSVPALSKIRATRKR